MVSRVTKLVLAGVAITFLITGCSKKDSSPTEPQQTAPSIPTVTFKGPNTNSTDLNVQMVKSYVTVMNAYTMELAPFSAMQGVQSGNTWTWTYTQGTLTVKFTATTQSDGSYQWKMVFNGTDPSDGTVYNNWTAIEGTTSADGKSGSWKIYDENKTILLAEFNWATSNNVLTGTMKEYTNGVFSGQIVLVNNPDNSGELRVYTGSVVTYKAVWQSNGSGQWWTYNSSGTQTGTSTWT